MSLRPKTFALLALLALIPAVARADAPAAAAAQPPGAKADEKKTELEQRMDRIGKAYRKLRKQVADPAQNASSLELIAQIEAAAKEALEFTPEKAEDIPADQRAKFVEDFKAGIHQLQDKFSELQGLVAAGKNDEAAKLVTEITDFEKKSHKEFKRPDKD